MKYFKNIEIAKEFAINPTTVTNWIEASLEGKNDLQLIKINKRNYIINNSHNLLIIEKLVASSRKYKHKSLRKSVKATPEFFKHFNTEQIADIINSIETSSEIPHKYTYINGGAKNWKNYVQRSFEDGITNTVTDAVWLFKNTENIILQELNNKKQINIVDIGAGEASPVKNLITTLLSKKKEIKYTAVDISSEMLEFAKENLDGWFSNKFPRSYAVRDINHQGVEDILFSHSRTSYPSESKNMVLFMGNTIENQLDYTRTLINLSSSLGSEDILFMGVTLDTDKSKMYFDFSKKPKETSSSSIKDINKMYEGWKELIIPKLLGLEIDDFNVDLFYDEQEKSRILQLELRKDVEVRIKNEHMNTCLMLHKGQRITSWRHRHHKLPNIINNLDDKGLAIKHVITSPDEAHAMIICRRK